MIDLSKKYYAVHVQASNFLNGIHYIPFQDEVIELMRREYAPVKSEVNWYYDGECLESLVRLYLMEKFSYDVREDERYMVMMHGDMEPVDMQAIINEPAEPRKVEVMVSVGKDECIQFNIPEAYEELNHKEGEYEGSIISCSKEAEANNFRIQIWRYSRELPHLTNTLRLYNLSVAWWEIAGHIDSIEQAVNVTTYNCHNSQFSFSVQVITHMLFWYDDDTPIYKE